MTLNEIKWMIESAAKFGLGGLVAGSILFLLLKNHISTYLSEKGKNLATKEDISQITHLVKGVEHQYNVLIKDMEAKQQLRMAGLDKRLQAHQEAFTWWRKMLIVGENLPKLVMECQEWWETNCLYLEPEVRGAFVSVYVDAWVRKELPPAGPDGDEIREARRRMSEFPVILFKAVNLPLLANESTEGLAQQSENIADT